VTIEREASTNLGDSSPRDFAADGYDESVSEVRMMLTHGAPAALARRAVEKTLRDWDQFDCTADVLLVTTELVQNVTKHTTDGGELRLLLQTASILIEVTDTDSLLPQPPEERGPRRVGGRGLILVAALALAWGSRNTTWAGHAGKIVWAELALSPPF
jgi:hypothetical protein